MKAFKHKPHLAKSISNSSSYFPQPLPHKISPVFPFSCASYLRSPPEKYEDGIICTTDNILRLDTKFNQHPIETQRTEQVLAHIRSQLASKKIKYLSHLAIDLRHCQGLSSKEFRFLALNITKYGKSLLSLSITLERYENWKRITNADLMWFSSLITKTLVNLKELKIVFRQTQSMNETAYWQLVCDLSKRCKKIESLHLSFIHEDGREFSKKFMKVATHHPTTYLRDLKNFRLTLSSSPYQPSQMDLSKITFNKSRFLQNLQELELLFVEIDGNVFNSLASSLFRYTKSIKSLNFQFQQSFADLGIFEKMMIEISRCTSTLEHLRFYFHCYSLFLEPIFAHLSFAENNKIKTLDIHFFVTHLTRRWFGNEQKNGLEPLYSKVLPQLPDLQSLRLNFEIVRGVDDNEVCNLIYTIARKLPKLEDLCLLFTGNRALTDHTVDYMIDKFCRDPVQRLPNLESCREITERMVEKLQASFNHFRPDMTTAITQFNDAKSDSSWHEPPDDLSDTYWDDSDDSDENLSNFLEEKDQNDVDDMQFEKYLQWLLKQMKALLELI